MMSIASKLRNGSIAISPSTPPRSAGRFLAGRIVAGADGAADWNAVLQSEILDPLGMKDTTYSDAAMTAAANHAVGHRYTVDGSVEVPFEQLSPYAHAEGRDE